MNKQYIAILGVLVIVIIGVAVMMSQPKQEMMKESTPEAMMEKKDAMMEKNDDVMMEKSDDTMMMKNETRYVPYTKTTFEALKSPKKVLFFYANWCPTCKPADADFTQQMVQIPEDVVLVRVNYNDTETDANEKELANTYQVTYQHTFIQIDEMGKEVTRWNGGKMMELLSNIK